MRRLCWILLLTASMAQSEWKPLFNGKDLSGWAPAGDGKWFVTADGVLVGQRKPLTSFPKEFPVSKQTYDAWRPSQAWLYTAAEFREYDLELEYWLPFEGNSGISIRDRNRAKYAVTIPPDGSRTPARLAYEIQLSNQYPHPSPSGSIYTFVDAKAGVQRDGEWNTLRIEVRDKLLRTYINGTLVAEHPGDPKRSLTGPVGLQLHDQYSLVMFRRIRIQEMAR